MLIDVEKETSGVGDVFYDAIVVGSGFAGLTIARELAAKKKKVALLEAGGDDYSDESQDIYRGKTINGPNVNYWDNLEVCRLRYFGGTSNHWAGLCFVPDAIDFEESDRWGLPGWPIRKTALDGYFDRAADIVDIAGQSLDDPRARHWSGTTLRMAGFAKSPPTVLIDKYFDAVAADPNIDCFLNCNMVDIRLADSLGQVSELVARTYQGAEFRFKGSRFVVACGAVENARLLLNSDKQAPGGVGNHADYVGRCFMEHLNVHLGRFVTSSSPIWQGERVALKPTREFMEKHGVLNSVLSFSPGANPETYGRLRVLKRYLRDIACSSDSLLEISRKISDFDCPGDGIITTLCEQAPNRDSRVTLGDEKDSLGLRRVVLDWRLKDVDTKTIRTLAMEAAKELARQDLGRVQLSSYILDEDEPLPAGGHCHQMGTTRMSQRPEDGVVDPNCRVHGIDNLYMAGSSVFSTGGGNNPTFEIVQLSLRLADHILRSG